jgi:hypothetical protein
MYSFVSYSPRWEMNVKEKTTMWGKGNNYQTKETEAMTKM